MTATVPRRNVNLMVLHLLTFGGLGLVHDDASPAPRVRPPRLALLAALAVAGERGLSRERLMSFFWPDSDEVRGRHSLRQALYVLRQELGRDVVRANEAMLSLDWSEITTDVREFRAALAADDCARAVAHYRGPFLDGFYLAGAPAFERWVEEERARFTVAMTGALLALASDAEGRGDHDATVEWWRQLTAVDPLSGRFAAGYLAALAARGDRARALAFVREHEALLRRELDAEPDPDVRRIEAKLRAGVGAVIGDEPEPAHASDPSAGALPSRSPAAPVSRAGSAPNTSPIPRRASRILRQAWIAGAASLLTVIATAAFARQRGWLNATDEPPTFAVGYIRDDGLPDSLRLGPVLTDMLATNLARVNGLPVLANSRLLELMRPGQDSPPATYIDAARRAGAEALVEGSVTATPNAGLELELRHVELRSGIVKRAYRVSGRDRYALVDSMTRAIANQLGLLVPGGSIAASTTSSPMAYRLYEEGLRAFHQSDARSARRLMRAALEEDSTFAMAAYYEAVLAEGDETTPDGRSVTEARHLARRLALRVPERERLLITAHMLKDNQEPDALAVAESLATRYPDDPQAMMIVGSVRSAAGDWAGAAAAMERAIAIDSAAGTGGGLNCRVCQGYRHLGEVYLWWDSLPAVMRTARRLERAQKNSHHATYLLALAAARLGDSTSAYAAFRQLLARNETDRAAKLDLDVTLEEYDVVERDVRQLLASSLMYDWGNGAWLYVIVLRNQGRLQEATRFHRTGTLPGLPVPTVEWSPGAFNEGILALERGDGRRAAAVFERLAHADLARSASGYRARVRAWNRTLQGMGLAAAGDTAAVRALADTVEYWGRASLYGRDRKAHHYLRGLVFAAEGRHEDAVREYRAAIHSPSLGFTRVNYELARCLMRLGRPREAVAALQPALRGEIDASNLYITRTELHELLAQAFDAAGERDSAAVHYRAVVKAWVRADPPFHARRAAARSWLTHHSAGVPTRARGPQP